MYEVQRDSTAHQPLCLAESKAMKSHEGKTPGCVRLAQGLFARRPLR